MKLLQPETEADFVLSQTFFEFILKSDKQFFNSPKQISVTQNTHYVVTLQSKQGMLL